MHFQDITLLLNIQEIKIINIDYPDNNTVVINAIPVDDYQKCPICQKDNIIGNSTPYGRKIRHLPIFEKASFIMVPAIFMKCKDCNCSYVWEYDFVAPYHRYSKALRDNFPKYVIDSTVKHAARVYKIPYSTAERIYKSWMNKEAARIQNDCIDNAKNSDELILGIDDFAIRKGHNYNTGIHDLSGETFLDVIPGRTIEELKKYFVDSPLALLNPKAIVMDLAKAYHSFAKEIFPNAIRVADRFHVNKYVIEALQNTRKTIENQLTPYAKKNLKLNFKILGKRQDQLTKEEFKLLQEILSYSNELKSVYEWKEAFIDWYDLSNRNNARIRLEIWINYGYSLNNQAINKCLKTIQNWKQEIINYHYVGFTNGIVEGRNNKIKTIQRRSYFLRNKISYKQRIILECNREHVYA